MVGEPFALDSLARRLSDRLSGMSEDEKAALWTLATGRHQQVSIVQGSSVDRVLNDYSRWSPGLRQSSHGSMHGLCSWRFDQAAQRRFHTILEGCLVSEAQQALAKTWKWEVMRIALALAGLYALLRVFVVPVLDLASAFLLAPWGGASQVAGLLHLLVVFAAVVLGLSLLIGEEVAYKSLARLSLLEADQHALAMATGGLLVVLDVGLQAALVWFQILPVEILVTPAKSFALLHGLRALLVVATVFLAIRVALEIKARELRR